MRKIWNITRKDLYGTFTDTSLLLIMLAAPLAVATIIGVTFGNVGRQSSTPPVTDIPVAIVSLDEGVIQGGNTQNNGQIFLDTFVMPDDVAAAAADPEAEMSADSAECRYQPRRADAAIDNELWKLIQGVQFEDPTLARACVDKGIYAAAVIIPADFSANISYGVNNTTLKPAKIEVYSDPNRPISQSIVRSVVENFANQTATGNIAIAAVIERFIAENPLNVTRIGDLTTSETFTEAVEAMFSEGSGLVNIEQQAVTGEEATFNPLVFIGASQAIFFALFTSSGGATNIMEERRNWTLQRLFMSPTSQFTILLGKMIGVFAMVLVQLGFLFIAFTVVSSLIYGEVQFIWGTNIPAILLVLFTSTLAVTGLGSITAAASKTPEQAGTVGAIVSMFNAMLGGAFGFSFGAPLTYLSVVYWGSDAFAKLATGRDSEVVVNVIVLAVLGVVTFLAGLYIFNRRMEVR